MTEATLAERSEHRYPLLSLVARFGRPDAHYFVLGIAVRVVATFLGIADVFLIGLGIDALFNGRALEIPLVPNAWIPSEPIPLLLFISATIFALNLTNNIGTLLGEYCSGIFAQRLLHRVRIDTFETASHLELGFFEANRTGDVMSALNDDVNRLDTFLTTIVGAAVWIAVTLVGAFVYMSMLNAQLALFVLLSGPLIAGINYRYSRRLEPLQNRVRAERGALNARLETNVGATDVVKAYTAEDYERERVAASSLDYFRAAFRSRRLAVRQGPVNRLVAGVWLLATLAVGIYWVVAGAPPFFAGTLTAGQLVPFLFYMERIRLPLTNLAGVVDHYTGSKAAARRIDGLASAEGRREGESGDDLAVEDARVTYDDVRFGYPGSERRALDGVSFTVEPGETVGIVGATGAGKSTLVDLLLRFYDVESGTIAVDGRDVRDVSPHSLRRAVGYVTQDTYLFDGTVRENIAYGAPDASDERIERAAREAGAHEFIAHLPDGYDTQVGERGERLSGGQRQRLAIARAVVGDPPVLVFDEATSHVDSETERVVQERLDELTADRTTFAIAHRLSTVRGADRILVLDDGRLVEEGTHDELVERGGTYATLWNVQIGEFAAQSP